MAQKLYPVYPLIDCFLERLTEKQLKSLTSGDPDEAIKILLAEVVLETLKLVIDNVLAILMKTANAESEQDLLSNISQITFQSLGIPPEIDSVSSRQLSNLIAEEVQESVQSALSTSSQVELHQHQHFTRPNRVSAMVSFAAKMIKEFMTKMKQGKQKPEDVEDGTEREEDIDSSEELSDTDNGCLSRDGLGKVPSVATQKSRVSVDNLKSRTLELLQEDIQKELSEVINPLLDDMPDCDNEKVQSEIAEELKSLSDNISDVICLNEKKKQTQNVMRKNMKHFFAKCFAKVWIHRLLNQLKWKNLKQTKDESEELVESLIESVTSQLQMSSGEEQEAGDENAKIYLINDHPSSKTLEFMKELSNTISSNFLSDSVTKANHKSHADMSADIQRKTWVFMVLMNWWLLTHVDVLSEKVNLPETDDMLLRDVAEKAASKPINTAEGLTEQDAALKMEEQKIFVKVVIEMFLWKLYRQVMMVPEKSTDINNWLFESIWAEVKDTDLHFTPETPKNLSKKIYKSMCRIWCGPNQVLFMLNLNNPVTNACIISVFKHHLQRQPNRPNAIRTFFSSLGKHVSRIFRRSNKGLIPHLFDIGTGS